MDFVAVDRRQQHDYWLHQNMIQEQQRTGADVEAMFQLATAARPLAPEAQQHLHENQLRLMPDLKRLDASLKAMTNSPGGHQVMSSHAALEWMEIQGFDPQALMVLRTRMVDQERMCSA